MDLLVVSRNGNSMVFSGVKDYAESGDHWVITFNEPNNTHEAFALIPETVYIGPVGKYYSPTITRNYEPFFRETDITC